MITASLLTCLLFPGCDSKPGAPDPEIPNWDGGFDVEPPELPASPELTPCPEGWVEIPPDDDEGVALCEPWPEGSPAALPVLTPCPEGWREVPPAVEGDLQTCDPWPTTGRVECGAGEAHFPGEAGCTPIGSPCPAGDWSEEIPAAADVLYVRAGEPAGGDGTQAAPFGTIGDAMAAAEAGTVIALSRGTFSEAVRMRRGATLWGACAAETLLTTSTWSDTEGTVTSNTLDATLRNLRVSGNRFGILVYQSSTTYGELHLEGVLVDGAKAAGLRADMQGTITGREVVVRNTQPRDDGQRGRGLQVETFGRAELERVTFEDNREIGVSVFGEGAAARLTDVAIRGTTPPEGWPHGWGIRCEDQALVEVTRGVVEENDTVGIQVSGVDALLRLTDVIVRDTVVEPRWEDGGGIRLVDGASAELARTAVIGNEAAGISLGDSQLSATDLLVADSQPIAERSPETALGFGVRGLVGATLELERTLVLRSRDVGVTLHGSGTRAFLTDLTVMDTAPRAGDDLYGRGLSAYAGATVAVNRGLFERNHSAGVLATDAQTAVDLTDVVVRDTAIDAEGVWGLGVVAVNDAAVTVARGFFVGNQGAGLTVLGAYSALTASDVVVRGTRSLEQGYFGRGINVQCSASEGVDARAVIERALIEDNQDIGVFVSHDGASVELTDAVVRNTAPDDLGAFGRGVEASAGAHLVLSRVSVDGNREVGIHTEGQRTDVAISDLVVRDTEANSRGEFGRGLQAQFGVAVELERGLFERNRELSVAAVAPTTRLRMTQVTVRETRTTACEQCGEAGIGVGVYGGAYIELINFQVTENAMCGVQLALGATSDGIPWPDAGEADLSEGEISFNTICGANVQAQTFDIDRLTERVIYRENGRNLDMQQLPVPDLGLED